jgi:hypothetical protein
VKLDKRHLVASLLLLVGSAVYNIWVFTRPAGGTAAAVIATMPLDAPAAALAPGSSGPAGLDPSQIAELPDVQLDVLPRWPRDPFENRRRAADSVMVDAAPEPVFIEEPDPVIASILYSSGRRRAILDGRIVGEGDRVGTVTVVEILPDAVVVESPARGRRTLRLRPPGTVGVGR